MQVIEVSTDSANIRVVAMDRNENREWLHRHALHQMLKAYRKEYGAINTDRLMDELTAYHQPKVVGVL